MILQRACNNLRCRCGSTVDQYNHGHRIQRIAGVGVVAQLGFRFTAVSVDDRPWNDTDESRIAVTGRGMITSQIGKRTVEPVFPPFDLLKTAIRIINPIDRLQTQAFDFIADYYTSVGAAGVPTIADAP